MTQVYSDAFQFEWSADNKTLKLKGSSLARSGRLTFMDVVLAGHERIVVEVTSEKLLHVRIGLRVIDQATGGMLAETEGYIFRRGSARLAADLRGVFGVVTVSLFLEAKNDALRTSLDFGLNKLMID